MRGVGRFLIAIVLLGLVWWFWINIRSEDVNPGKKHHNFDSHMYKSSLAGPIPQTSIPKMIHQTVQSKHNIPKKVLDYMTSWKVQNPDFEYILWDDENVEQFVKDFFPMYVHAFKSLPKSIMKADVFRYMVLFVYGGVVFLIISPL
jgi:alpha 1,6-mannosyltransferase